MVAQLDDASVSALAFSSAAFLIVTSLLFGVVLAVGAIISHHWGAKELVSMRAYLYLSISISILLVVPIVLFFVFTPETLMSLGPDSTEVQEAGVKYLRIAGWSLLMWPISVGIGMALNMIGQARLSMMISVSFVVVALALNFLLIFGIGPIPELGVKGAALGTLITNILFLGIYILFVSKENHPFLFSYTELKHHTNKRQLKKIIKHALPLTMNGALWAGGLFIYQLIFSHHAVTSFTVVALIAPIVTISMVFFNGLATAASAKIGEALGQGNNTLAVDTAHLSIKLSLLTGLSISLILMSIYGLLPYVYPSTSQKALDALTPVFLIASAFTWCRGLNIVMINGILRTGADNKYILVLDTASSWVVSIPLTIMAAYIFNCPLAVIYLFSLSEEFIKSFFAYRRVGREYWVRSLV